LLIIKCCCRSSILRQTPGSGLFIHGTEFVSITKRKFKALFAAVLDEARVSLIWELIDVELPQKGSRRARLLLRLIPMVDCLFPALTSMDDGILNVDWA
jgi:hypothetical protein